jgi:hypothetical protein
MSVQIYIYKKNPCHTGGMRTVENDWFSSKRFKNYLGKSVRGSRTWYEPLLIFT